MTKTSSILRLFFFEFFHIYADETCESSAASSFGKAKLPLVRAGAATLSARPQVQGHGAFPHDHHLWMPDFLKAPTANMPAVFRYEGSGDSLGYELGAVLDQILPEHGAVLVKGFPLNSPHDFSRMALSTNWTFMEYVGGTTSRPVVAPKVMPASDEAPTVCMEYHNDGSFGARPPTLLLLYCEQAPKQGGQALLYDSRQILKVLKEEHRGILQELLERKIRYYQFFPDQKPSKGIVTLRDAFGSRCGETLNFSQAVEEYLLAHDYGFEWVANGLRTWNVKSPVAHHPHSREETWFNQVTAMHCSVFDNHPAYPELNRDVSKRSDPCLMRGNMPFHTTYGDGGEIPLDVLDVLRQVQWNNAVAFDYVAGTVLAIDNYLVAHGRFSFEPPRAIFTAQATRDIASGGA